MSEHLPTEGFLTRLSENRSDGTKKTVNLYDLDFLNGVTKHTIDMADKKPTETPMMKQFFAVKAEHPEAMLLFRCGDFYETYGDDALTASKVLGIVLTKRSSATPGAIPMAGFPHHSLETYLPRLVRAGYKVAVCDQLESLRS